jgi:hypothetical protein
MRLHLFKSISFYAFVPHPSITMYCRGLFILAVLSSTIWISTSLDSTTSTNAEATQPTNSASTSSCYNETNIYTDHYLDILCSCGAINQADASPIDRWTDADCDWALGSFNHQWLYNLTTTLPYIPALSAYWGGPESNVYPLLICRPLVINELQIGIVM